MPRKQPVKGFFIVLCMDKEGNPALATDLLTEAEANTWRDKEDPEHKRTQIVPADGYPPPSLQPGCQCKDRPMQQMFCPFGHMTECHFGLTCSEAQCGHLPRYEDADDRAFEEERAREMFGE